MLQYKKLVAKGGAPLKNWQWYAVAEDHARRGMLWRMLGKDQYIRVAREHFPCERLKAKKFREEAEKGKQRKDTRPKDTWNKQSAVKNTGGLRERGKKTEYRAKNHVEEHRLLAAYHRASRRARKCHVVILVPALQQFHSGRLRLVGLSREEAQQLGGAQSVEKI